MSHLAKRDRRKNHFYQQKHRCDGISQRFFDDQKEKDELQLKIKKIKVRLMIEKSK